MMNIKINLILQKNILKEIVDHFDNEYTLNKEALEKKITRELQYHKRNLISLHKLSQINKHKYNAQKIKLALTLRDKILCNIPSYSIT